MDSVVNKSHGDRLCLILNPSFVWSGLRRWATKCFLLQIFVKCVGELVRLANFELQSCLIQLLIGRYGLDTSGEAILMVANPTKVSSISFGYSSVVDVSIDCAAHLVVAGVGASFDHEPARASSKCFGVRGGWWDREVAARSNLLGSIVSRGASSSIRGVHPLQCPTRQ